MPKVMLDLPDPILDWLERQAAETLSFSINAEIVEAVLRRMPRTEADAFRSARLDALVQEGLDSLDRGEGVVVEDVGAYLDALMAEVRAERIDKAA